MCLALFGERVGRSNMVKQWTKWHTNPRVLWRENQMGQNSHITKSNGIRWRVNARAPKRYVIVIVYDEYNQTYRRVKAYVINFEYCMHACMQGCCPDPEEGFIHFFWILNWDKLLFD